jgi:F-type H+-transporting ATPase subunit epsilon
MAQTFDLQIATPERMLVHEQASEAQIPALNGYLGVLPDHAPLLSELGYGTLSYSTGGQRHYLAIHGGFLEIMDNNVRVLATRAEAVDEIDVKRAQEALDRANKRLASTDVSIDMGRALASAMRAQARLECASCAGTPSKR